MAVPVPESACGSLASNSSATTVGRIRILTLNCWGLKFLSKFRHERLSEIGRQLALAEEPYEIVGLQECWTQQDYESIRQQTQATLPYGKFYHGGIFGAGLAILSKWPIEASSMVAYPLNGRPTAFFRGDWFVGKGVACARIRFGPRRSDVAEVFCTHLHAPYEREPHDSYLCHRTAQAWEIAKLMRGAAERGHLVIGLGDFNMLPSSFAHQLVVAHSPVRDAWLTLYPRSAPGRDPNASAMQSLYDNGATCDAALNTWRWPTALRRRLHAGYPDAVVDPAAPDPLAQRLDYIFVGDGAYPPDYPSPTWEIVHARVVMTQPHPTLRCSLSDHFGVEAVITRESAQEIPSPAAEQQKQQQQQQQQEVAGLPSETAELSRNRSLALSVGLTPESYDNILGMVAKYVRRERQQRRWRLVHFGLSVVVSIACFVGVWWTGPVIYVAFVLCLVSSLSLVAGVLDGLIGGLFVSAELRALKEFEWEIRNARAFAEQASQAAVKPS